MSPVELLLRRLLKKLSLIRPAGDDDLAFFDRELELLEQPSVYELLEEWISKPETIRALQSLGAGLLGESKADDALSSTADQLLAELGQRLRAYVKALPGNRTVAAQQKRKAATVANVKRLDRLKKLDPSEFEYWTKGYFERHGFKAVRVTQLSNDFGIDVIMRTSRGRQAVVQCKRYKGTVDRPTVQQTYGVMKLVNAKLCYVVTTGRFTRAAFELNERKDIHLLDGAFLVSRRKPPGSK